MKKHYKEFPLAIRIMSFILIITFLAQDIVWANPDSFTPVSSANNKLAPESIFRRSAEESLFTSSIYKMIEDICKEKRLRLNELTLADVKDALEKIKDQPWLKITQPVESEILVTFPYGGMFRFYDPHRISPYKYTNKIIQEIRMPEGSLIGIQYRRTELIKGPQPAGEDKVRAADSPAVHLIVGSIVRSSEMAYLRKPRSAIYRIRAGEAEPAQLPAGDARAVKIEEAMSLLESSGGKVAERAKRLGPYLTVIGLTSLMTNFIFSDFENGIYRAVHAGRRRMVLYIPMKLVDFLTVKWLALLLNAGMRFLDTYDKFASMFREEDIPADRLEMMHKELRSQSPLIIDGEEAALWREEELDGIFGELVKEDNRIRRDDILRVIEKIMNQADKLEMELENRFGAEESLGGRKVNVELFRKEYMVLASKYGLVASYWEIMGERGEAKKYYKKKAETIKLVQRVDSGDWPVPAQEGIVEMYLRAGMHAEAVRELKVFLTGEGWPAPVSKKARESFREQQGFRKDIIHNIFYAVKNEILYLLLSHESVGSAQERRKINAARLSAIQLFDRFRLEMREGDLDLLARAIEYKKEGRDISESELVTTIHDAVGRIAEDTLLIAKDNGGVIARKPYVRRGINYKAVLVLADFLDCFGPSMEENELIKRICDKAAVGLVSIIASATKDIDYPAHWTNFAIPEIRKIANDSGFSDNTRAMAEELALKRRSAIDAASGLTWRTGGALYSFLIGATLLPVLLAGGILLYVYWPQGYMALFVSACAIASAYFSRPGKSPESVGGLFSDFSDEEIEMLLNYTTNGAITVQITKGCSRACPICAMDAKGGRIIQMPFTRQEKILKILKEHGVNSVNLYLDNEPLEYYDESTGKDLSDVLVLIQSMGLYTAITTHGWPIGNDRAKEAAKKIAALPFPVEIIISMHLYYPDIISAKTEEDLQNAINRHLKYYDELIDSLSPKSLKVRIITLSPSDWEANRIIPQITKAEKALISHAETAWKGKVSVISQTFILWMGRASDILKANDLPQDASRIKPALIGYQPVLAIRPDGKAEFVYADQHINKFEKIGSIFKDSADPAFKDFVIKLQKILRVEASLRPDKETRRHPNDIYSVDELDDSARPMKYVGIMGGDINYFYDVIKFAARHDPDTIAVSALDGKSLSVLFAKLKDVLIPIRIDDYLMESESELVDMILPQHMRSFWDYTDRVEPDERATPKYCDLGTGSEVGQRQGYDRELFKSILEDRLRRVNEIGLTPEALGKVLNDKADDLFTILKRLQNEFLESDYIPENPNEEMCGLASKLFCEVFKNIFDEGRVKSILGYYDPEGESVSHIWVEIDGQIDVDITYGQFEDDYRNQILVTSRDRLSSFKLKPYEPMPNPLSGALFIEKEDGPEVTIPTASADTKTPPNAKTLRYIKGPFGPDSGPLSRRFATGKPKINTDKPNKSPVKKMDGVNKNSRLRQIKADFEEYYLEVADRLLGGEDYVKLWNDLPENTVARIRSYPGNDYDEKLRDVKAAIILAFVRNGKDPRLMEIAGGLKNAGDLDGVVLIAEAYEAAGRAIPDRLADILKTTFAKINATMDFVSTYGLMLPSGVNCSSKTEADKLLVDMLLRKTDNSKDGYSALVAALGNYSNGPLKISKSHNSTRFDAYEQSSHALNRLSELRIDWLASDLLAIEKLSRNNGDCYKALMSSFWNTDMGEDIIKRTGIKPYCYDPSSDVEDDAKDIYKAGAAYKRKVEALKAKMAQNKTKPKKGPSSDHQWNKFLGKGFRGRRQNPEPPELRNDTPPGLGISQGGVLPHRGVGNVNDSIIKILGEHLEELRSAAKGSRAFTQKDEEQFDVFKKWFAQRVPGEDVPADKQLPLKKIADDSILVKENGRSIILRIVELPVFKLGLIEGRSFTAHLALSAESGGRRDGIIWVAAGPQNVPRDTVDVELDIMHEREECRIALRKAIEDNKELSDIVRWRDEGSKDAYEFFRQAHMDAWKAVAVFYQKDNPKLFERAKERFLEARRLSKIAIPIGAGLGISSSREEGPLNSEEAEAIKDLGHDFHGYLSRIANISHIISKSPGGADVSGRCANLNSFCIEIGYRIARLETLDPESDRVKVRDELERINRLSGQIMDILTPEDIQIYKVLASKEFDQFVVQSFEDSCNAVMWILEALLNQSVSNKSSLDLIELVSVASRLELLDKGIDCPELARGVPAVYGRRGEVFRIILNILRDAGRAVQNGGHVGIKAYSEGQNAVLVIADTGEGLSDAQREAFMRGNIVERKGGTGHGRGLDIVRRFVAANGGSITAEPNRGKGTVFTIRLPREPSPKIQNPIRVLDIGSGDGTGSYAHPNFEAVLANDLMLPASMDSIRKQVAGTLGGLNINSEIELIGIDISPIKVEAARRIGNNIRLLDIFDEKATGAEFSDNSIDIITCYSPSEYVVNTAESGEIRRKNINFINKLIPVVKRLLNTHRVGELWFQPRINPSPEGYSVSQDYDFSVVKEIFESAAFKIEIRKNSAGDFIVAKLGVAAAAPQSEPQDDKVSPPSIVPETTAQNLYTGIPPELIKQLTEVQEETSKLAVKLEELKAQQLQEAPQSGAAESGTSLGLPREPSPDTDREGQMDIDAFLARIEQKVRITDRTQAPGYYFRRFTMEMDITQENDKTKKIIFISTVHDTKDSEYEFLEWPFRLAIPKKVVSSGAEKDFVLRNLLAHPEARLMMIEQGSDEMPGNVKNWLKSLGVDMQKDLLKEEERSAFERTKLGLEQDGNSELGFAVKIALEKGIKAVNFDIPCKFNSLPIVYNSLGLNEAAFYAFYSLNRYIYTKELISKLAYRWFREVGIVVNERDIEDLYNSHKVRLNVSPAEGGIPTLSNELREEYMAGQVLASDANCIIAVAHTSHLINIARRLKPYLRSFRKGELELASDNYNNWVTRALWEEEGSISQGVKNEEKDAILVGQDEKGVSPGNVHEVAEVVQLSVQTVTETMGPTMGPLQKVLGPNAENVEGGEVTPRETDPIGPNEARRIGQKGAIPEIATQTSAAQSGADDDRVSPDGSPSYICNLLRTDELKEKFISVEEIRLRTKGKMSDGHLSAETIERDLGTLSYLHLVEKEIEGKEAIFKAANLSPPLWDMIDPILASLRSRPDAAAKEAARIRIDNLREVYGLKLMMGSPEARERVLAMVQRGDFAKYETVWNAYSFIAALIENAVSQKYPKLNANDWRFIDAAIRGFLYEVNPLYYMDDKEQDYGIGIKDRYLRDPKSVSIDAPIFLLDIIMIEFPFIMESLVIYSDRKEDERLRYYPDEMWGCAVKLSLQYVVNGLARVNNKRTADISPADAAKIEKFIAKAKRFNREEYVEIRSYERGIEKRAAQSVAFDTRQAYLRWRSGHGMIFANMLEHYHMLRESDNPIVPEFDFFTGPILNIGLESALEIPRSNNLVTDLRHCPGADIVGLSPILPPNAPDGWYRKGMIQSMPQDWSGRFHLVVCVGLLDSDYVPNGVAANNYGIVNIKERRSFYDKSAKEIYRVLKSDGACAINILGAYKEEIDVFNETFSRYFEIYRLDNEKEYHEYLMFPKPFADDIGPIGEIPVSITAAERRSKKPVRGIDSRKYLTGFDSDENSSGSDKPAAAMGPLQKVPDIEVAPRETDPMGPGVPLVAQPFSEAPQAIPTPAIDYVKELKEKLTIGTENLAPVAEIQQDMKGKGLILFADAILERGAVIDLRRELAQKDTKLEDATLVLYGRKAGCAKLLDDIIRESGKNINTVVVEERDLIDKSGRDDVYVDDAETLEKLINYLPSRGLGKDKIFGVIKGRTENYDTVIQSKIDEVLGGYKIPAVYFESDDGMYSLAEAINKLNEIAKGYAGTDGYHWYQKLPPITRQDLQKIYEEYKNLLASALSA